MKSSLYTYGFLAVMAAALITLAVLQYKWLGSVSDAEKERLEENLSASSENFVADFNEIFTELGQTFRIQVSDPTTDILPSLNNSYKSWVSNSSYPGLVDSVFLVKKSEFERPEVFLFSSDPTNLNLIPPSQSVHNWIQKEAGKGSNSKKVSLRVHPEFGDPSYLSIPIQFLDMIQVSNREFGQKIEVQLSVDQLDDIILIKLDDDLIKEQLIPDIAKVYFSDSFDDQYTLSLLKNTKEPYVYYTSGDSKDLPEPDFKSSLDRFSISNIMVFKSDPYSVENLRLSTLSDSLEISIRETNESDRIITDTTAAVSNGATRHLFKENFSYFDTRDTTTSANFWSVRNRDTTITSSLTGSLASSPWQLWLSFKEGSLDAFVDKTRNRNLGISFGILSILGISVVMIVVFSQRSRELAEQQMLFVAGVSHELRTPITVIRSAAENLNEGFVHDEKRRKEYASLMLNEGRRLSDMVDQIMEFSGIQAGKRVYSFAEVEIEELINDLLREYKSVLEEAEIQLEYSFTTSQTFIYADRDALYLSISNLLNNAIKFKGESKKIRLGLGELKGKNAKQSLAIIVQDYGTGIPVEEQKKVFKPFFRGKKSVDDQVKGNGIGLSLVKKVVDAHKGEIRLKSKVGEGSTFILILPFKGNNE